MKSNFSKELWLILAVVEFIWARSSFDKLSGGKFVSGMSGVLTKFASNNPYPFMKNFLQTVAIPQANLFGNLTMWGEFLVALSMGVALLYLLFANSQKWTVWLLSAGLLGGVFLNLVFWLSSGWTSPSTDGLNLLMLGVGLAGVAYCLKLLKQVNY